MGTNRVILKSAEQQMADFTPVYQPFFSLILQAAKKQLYSQVVGKIEFTRVTTKGDIRAKQLTPKDTEMKQIAVGEKKKNFNKYFKAIQLVQSNLQDQEGVENIISETLDENNKLADEVMLYGEGTSHSDVLNNGLYYSSDEDYTLESSTSIASSPSHLDNMYSKIVENAEKANQIAGRKVLVVYGSTATSKLTSLFSATQKPLISVLREALPGYDIVKLPPDVTKAGENGWMIVNLDQIKVHYAGLPEVHNQGVDEKAMETWHNFLMGSWMIECLVKNAIIRQPVTFA